MQVSGNIIDYINPFMASDPKIRQAPNASSIQGPI